MLLFVCYSVAYQWFQQPFLGLFLEPNNVISQVSGDNWPAKESGAQDYEQLIAVNNIPAGNAEAIRDVLGQGDDQISLTLQPQGGGANQITVTSRQFKPVELMTWFGIPYFIGIGFWVTGAWAYRLSKGRQPSRAFLSFTSAATIITAGYFDMNTSQHFVLGWAIALPIAGFRDLPYLPTISPTNLASTCARANFAMPKLIVKAVAVSNAISTAIRCSSNLGSASGHH